MNRWSHGVASEEHTVYESEGLSNNVSGLWTLPRTQAARQARRVPWRRKCLQSSCAGQQCACSLRWTSLACLLSTALQPSAWPLPQILSALPPQVSPICLRQIKGFTLISCNSWICSCMRILEPAHIDVGMSCRWHRCCAGSGFNRATAAQQSPDGPAPGLQHVPPDQPPQLDKGWQLPSFSAAPLRFDCCAEAASFECSSCRINSRWDP
jgi:hypothetical protein